MAVRSYEKNREWNITGTVASYHCIAGHMNDASIANTLHFDIGCAVLDPNIEVAQK